MPARPTLIFPVICQFATTLHFEPTRQFYKGKSNPPARRGGSVREYGSCCPEAYCCSVTTRKLNVHARTRQLPRWNGRPAGRRNIRSHSVSTSNGAALPTGLSPLRALCCGVDCLPAHCSEEARPEAASDSAPSALLARAPSPSQRDVAKKGASFWRIGARRQSAQAARCPWPLVHTSHFRCNWA